MKAHSTTIPDLLVLEPRVFGDERGFFYECFNQKIFNEITKSDYKFVQDNHSKSQQGVLRGLHYQVRHPQGKLVRVTNGSVFDVAVDLRPNSKTFGHWYSIELSSENKKLLWIPPGFAHGFYVLSPFCEFLYKTTDYYFPEFERTILWNDKDLKISWPIGSDSKSGHSLTPMLSSKDQRGLNFKDAEPPLI